ncbi:hypothetical protein [Acinetobacter calcoaceticus]|uniref:hypothetical protein n=1 Tax=Acinetobacter calcoaceticus TaxID=471 RepID=UPI001F0ADBAE|nr:hypothetical protein [Acinetobacter calcoaceticus]
MKMIYKRLLLIFIALCSTATYAQQDISNQEKNSVDFQALKFTPNQIQQELKQLQSIEKQEHPKYSALAQQWSENNSKMNDFIFSQLNDKTQLTKENFELLQKQLDKTKKLKQELNEMRINLLKEANMTLIQLDIKTEQGLSLKKLYLERNKICMQYFQDELSNTTVNANNMNLKQQCIQANSRVQELSTTLSEKYNISDNKKDR